MRTGVTWLKRGLSVINLAYEYRNRTACANVDVGAKCSESISQVCVCSPGARGSTGRIAVGDRRYCGEARGLQAIGLLRLTLERRRCVRGSD